MKTTEIQIDEMNFKIQELDTENGLKFAKYDKSKLDEMARDLIKLSVIEPKELDLTKVPFRIGNKLLMEINKLNGFVTDFPTVPGQSQVSQNG